ncbi:hypothetical protein AURDEDRAFT_169272 [Auricularia subglabra TFB-10046 SS5]|nr:hypothetical protein AURDEDRAFT_169272 [Auricularia subglabra TFB-10046 SS5]
MSSLSPQHRRKLQEVVREVLQASRDPPAKQNDDAAAVLATAVRSAVDEVVSQFLETRNAKSSDSLLPHLPTELGTACFRLLDFRGRVAVSHVSRAWRRVALADCGLWNAVRLAEARPSAREMLETLLARSGSVPFEFEWATYTPFPDALLDVIARNMGRMGSLVLWGGSKNSVLEHLLAHKAPWLRRFAPGDYTVAVLSADWGSQWVPRLEDLQVENVWIPANFQPLPALLSLEMRLAKGSSIPSLSLVFPKLVQLRLGGLYQDSFQALGAPPPSCRRVFLGTPMHNATLDYSSFLKACYDNHISRIKLFNVASISPSIQEFAHATRGKCRMTIHSEGIVILECDGDSIVRAVHGYYPLSILREARCFAYLDRLSDLSLSLELLLALQLLQPLPTNLFPSLYSLRAILTPKDIPSMRHLVDGGTPPLHMPRLAELALDAAALEYDRDDPDGEPGHDVSWLTVALPGMLHLLISMERPRLETLEVVMASRRDAVHFASRTDLTALRGLATTLRVVDEDTYGREHPWLVDDDED